MTEAEELRVLFDYDYEHNEKKISIKKDETLKLILKTNQHWWKVLRPGVNKAFFVPAQYVEPLSKNPAKIDEAKKSETKKNDAKKIDVKKNPTPSPSFSKSFQLLHSKMKRSDSSRGSKKTLKLKPPLSASLEELAQQIKFPGISPIESSKTSLTKNDLTKFPHHESSSEKNCHYFETSSEKSEPSFTNESMSEKSECSFNDETSAEKREPIYSNEAASEKICSGYDSKSTIEKSGRGYYNETSSEKSGRGYKNETSSEKSGRGYINETSSEKSGRGYINETSGAKSGGSYNNDTPSVRSGRVFSYEAIGEKSGRSYNNDTPSVKSGRSYEDKSTYEKCGRSYEDKSTYEKSGRSYEDESSYKKSGRSYEGNFTSEKSRLGHDDESKSVKSGGGLSYEKSVGTTESNNSVRSKISDYNESHRPSLTTDEPVSKFTKSYITSSFKSGKSKPVPLPRRGVGCSTDEGTPSPKPLPKIRANNNTYLTQSSSPSSASSEHLHKYSSSEEKLDGSTNSSYRQLHKKYESGGSLSSGEISFEKALNSDTNYDNSSSRRMKPKENYADFSSLPKRPASSEVPLRILSENWAEYVAGSEKRIFYYNKSSGQTSWKPPRISSNSSLRNSRNSLNFLNNFESSTTAANNGSKDNNKCSNIPIIDLNEEINVNANNGGSEIEVPFGWECSFDETTGSLLYRNKLTGARWFSHKDADDKIYYYEENSNSSSWALPVPSISLQNDENSSSSQLSKSGTSDSLEIPESEVMVRNKRTPSPLSKKRHSAGEAVEKRNSKTRSMLLPQLSSRKMGEGVDEVISSNSRMNSLSRSGSHSIWTSYSRDEDSNWLKVMKEGSLSKTKITENGKRLSKKWVSAYVVLTQEHLSLFKDEKSFLSRKSELEIELSGCTVVGNTDKTSRKNVFQLNTSTDLQILFQAEDNEKLLSWVEEISQIIKRQPVQELLKLKNLGSDPYMDSQVVGEKKVSHSLIRSKSTKLKITGSVENLNGGSEEKNKIRAQLRRFFNKRPARESLVKKGIYKDEAVFGCHLDKLCSREGRDVPLFVEECIRAIESREDFLKSDGIYRASGNLSQVQKIRLLVDQNSLTCLYTEEDVHVLAGALKLFFREMKEPLIPFNYFHQALSVKSLKSGKERLDRYREIVSKLPVPNRATLHLLLKHLLKVSEFSEFNRMLVPNLAIVFGPTLMWPPTESANMALDLMQQNEVIEALLLHFSLIFQRS